LARIGSVFDALSGDALQEAAETAVVEAVDLGDRKPGPVVVAFVFRILHFGQALGIAPRGFQDDSEPISLHELERSYDANPTAGDVDDLSSPQFNARIGLPGIAKRHLFEFVLGQRRRIEPCFGAVNAEPHVFASRASLDWALQAKSKQLAALNFEARLENRREFGAENVKEKVLARPKVRRLGYGDHRALCRQAGDPSTEQLGVFQALKTRARIDETLNSARHEVPAYRAANRRRSTSPSILGGWSQGLDSLSRTIAAEPKSRMAQVAKTSENMNVSPELDAAREQFILEWGRMSSSWGINRTMAQIHALLFITGEALSADEIMDRLQISRGNASMNLRDLMDWGIIRRFRRKGERKDTYVSDSDPWEMFVRVARERKRRELDPTAAAIRECVAKLPSGDHSEDAETFRNRLNGLLEIFDLIDAVYRQALVSDEAFRSAVANVRSQL